MTDTQENEYTVAEEIVHSLTHGLGIIASIVALAVMVGYAMKGGDIWHITSVSIFGATLILMYSASTLYHSVFHAKAKAFLQRIDHAAIYLLIAGTYTPFLLVSLRDDNVWAMFIGVWLLAVLGVIFEFIDVKFLKKISLGLYLGMGWLAVFIVGPLIDNLAFGGLVLLVGGGIAYTVGAIFYAWDSLPFNHAVWHMFVIAGSTLHFASVFWYVTPSVAA